MIPFIAVVAVIHIASLLGMGFMLFEYRHIHEKHMVLLQSFGDPHIPHKRWGRWLLMGIYALSTLAISGVTIAFLLYLLQFYP